MTVPSYFNREFRFGQEVGFTTVATAMTKIISEITSLTDPWTLVSGTEYRSPVPATTVSSDQRSMRVEFSVISPTRMGFHTKDSNGATVLDGAIDIVTSATAEIFSGPHHLCVEFVEGATRESAWANIVDTTPLSHLVLGTYVVANAHRIAAGTVQGDLADDCKMIDQGPVGQEGKIGFWGTHASVTGKTTGGSIFPLPAEVRIEGAGAAHRNAGKLDQMLVAPSDQNPGDTLIIPLDDATTGGFFILGKTSPAADSSGRLAVRRS